MDSPILPTCEPPQLALSSFEEAIRQIQGVVGKSSVVLDEAEIEKRSRVIIPEAQKPSAFVFPGGVQEIQAIVRIANQFKLALWTCSRGKNWGYGSATPFKAGSVVLMLERLNKIIELNESLAYVVLEPGVTYRQL